MPRSLAALAKQAARAQQSDAWFGFLLEIRHDLLVAPLRFVNDTLPVDRLGHTWTPYLFDVKIPDEDPDQLAQVTLTLDNVSRDVLDQIRAIDAPLDVDLYVTSSLDVSTIGPFTMTWRNLQWNRQQIEGTLRVEDVLNDSWPKDEFIPSKFPGLYR